MKKLSVIVPIYNAESTLHRCVDSILRQEIEDFEIILVDDGSSDLSLDICNKYAESDKRIVVCHKKNAGLVAARKSGVELASGKYIGFVDSDDYVDADMYPTLLAEADRNHADIITGGIILDYSDHSINSYNLLPEGYYSKEAIEKNVIPQMLVNSGFWRYGIIPGVVTKIFKKSVLVDSLRSIPDELTLGEDVAITSYSMLAAQSLSIIRVASYHYIQTESSMIRGYSPKRFTAACQMYACIEKIKMSAYQNQIGAYFACVLYGILADCVHNNEFTPKKAKEIMKNLVADDVAVNALKSADVSQWSFQDKIKVTMMKYRMINALYAILKR